ncbi:hypothetical protein ACF0H5_020938 [Mactra antiquata]
MMAVNVLSVISWMLGVALLFGLKVKTQEFVNTPGNNSISIGVISNGSINVQLETIDKYSYIITLVHHTVQISEIFQIFRAVRELDADDSVDVIMLFDFESSSLFMSDILEAKNKKLIKWGERTRHTTTLSGRTKRHASDHDICGDEKWPTDFEDPNCLTDLNTTSSDATMFTQLGPQTITAMVKSLKWKAVVIIHETSTERESGELVDLLSADGVMFSIFNADKVDDLHELLAKLYTTMVSKFQDINIVVVSEFYSARKILRTANLFDENRTHNASGTSDTLLKKFARWLVVVYGQTRGVSNSLKACASQLDNVAILSIPEIVGASAKDSWNIIDSIIDDVRKDDELVGVDDFKDAVITRLEQEAANWTPEGSPKCLGYNIETLLWAKTGGTRTREFSSVGYVEINGNVVIESDIFPNMKYGYNGFEFHISTLPYSPFVKKEIINGTAVYSGMCVDLMEELAHKLNFTYKLSEPEDQKWGSYEVVDNKTIFNGLVGQLQRGEVDIVIAPLSRQSEREKVMDFSYTFYYEYTTIMMKKPNINATKWRTLIDPFKWEVHVAIGVSLFFVTIMGFLIEKYNPFYQQPTHAQDRYLNGGLHTWHSSFWYMYGALLCQGGVHLPASMSGRTLVSFWWLFCIIVVGTYCGNLIAFLTVTKERPPFETMKEMVEQKGQYKWGTMGGTAWENIFATSSRQEYKAINEGLQEFKASDPDVLHNSHHVHMEKVSQGDYAWIGDKTTIEIQIGEECDLMKTKDEFLPLKYAIGFPNNSPHVQGFSQELMTLDEMGIFQIWKRKNWPKASFCAGKMTTEAKPITLIDVQSAFYVLVVGMFLGCSAFLCEFIIHKYKQLRASHEQTSIPPGTITVFNRHTCDNNQPDASTNTLNNLFSNERTATIRTQF